MTERKTISKNIIKMRIFYVFCVFLWNLKTIEGCYKFPPGVRDPCEGIHCDFGGVCVPSTNGKNSTCKMAQRCDDYGDSMESIPVCASDDQDYPNTCEMRRASFTQMKNITVKYFGRCGMLFFFSNLSTFFLINLFIFKCLIHYFQ